MKQVYSVGFVLSMLMMSNWCMEEQEDGSTTVQKAKILSLKGLALTEVILQQAIKLKSMEKSAGQEMLMETESKIPDTIINQFKLSFLPEVARTYYFLFNAYFDVARDYGFSLGELSAYQRIPDMFRTELIGTNCFANSLVITKNYYIDSLQGLEKILFKQFITKFIINHNILSRLPSLISLMSNLERLDLSYNNIKSIEDNALQGLGELTSVTLSHNKLKKIHDKAFVGCAKLTVLNVNNNKIDVIEADSLSHLSRLTILNLAVNQLSTVPRELSMLTQLQLLTIGQNPIPKEARDELEKALPGVTISWGKRPRSRTYIRTTHDNAT